MIETISGTTGLWWAVILSGIYHGLNPGMGWPLAVSSALMQKRHGALIPALGALAIGHFLAMIAMLLPFSLLMSLILWEFEIRMTASIFLILLGLFLFLYNKHPRFLSRVKPSRLMLWSFLVAIAHGAGLMLVPIYLGICRAERLDAGHEAASALMTSNIGSALIVSLVHTGAMMISGAVIAMIIYFWLGLKFLSSTWFNLDRIWAASLILVGALSVYAAFVSPHI